jgi:transcriptional regulator with XRE-family HTH domain
MKERIKKLIECKNIQPGEFAIILGIQRSNISHILNGRNKPGASLIEKILNLFPELNARWLLTGEGTMFSSIDRVEQPVKKNIPEISIEKKQPESNKKIEKIILLHNDGSFLVFDK